ARGGRDSIDHAPGAHDDIANVVAGVLVMTAGEADSNATWAAVGQGYRNGASLLPPEANSRTTGGSWGQNGY
ncbi:MAG: hypothetical protein ACRYHQ_20780, partial [Janthinobacterium lividum]